MTSSQKDKSLLGSLRKLFSSIVMLHMQNLARPKRKGVAEGVPQNVMSSLSECIEKLAENAARDAGTAASLPAGTVGNSEVRDSAPLMPVSSPQMEVGRLSVFFRNAHRHSAVSLDAGDRLMQHTWEHIHASIRIAHQGDVKTARLHVELANNAFKEASRYLSPPVHERFAHDVTKVLREINAEPA
jgi:hypothetical protein